MSNNAPIAMPGDFPDGQAAYSFDLYHTVLFLTGATHFGLIRTGSPHFGQVPQFSLLAVPFTMANDPTAAVWLRAMAYREIWQVSAGAFIGIISKPSGYHG